MSNPLTHSVFCILDDNDQIIGTGFLVLPNLGVTCAHIVQSVSKVVGEKLRVQFHMHMLIDDALIKKYDIQISNIGWPDLKYGDISFLEFLEPLPDDVKPIALGRSEDSFGNDYLALGYPDFGVIEGRWPRGKIGGPLRVNGYECIDIQGQEIKEGMSGGAVYDLKSNRVIGMISFFQDEQRPPIRFAYAIPSESLALALPSLRLWPLMYGPDEWQEYLEFLSSSSGNLTLPDGRKVPLEKIYVSLRADEMNATERKAEHDLYLQDLEKIKEQRDPESADPYEEHNFIRRIIVQHPHMQMLISRNWEASFTVRNKEKLNLADVVKKHSCSVLLGDPGSGKTTLGKWLTLQQSRALFNKKERLVVPLDLLQPGLNTNSTLENSENPGDEEALREIQKELDSLKNSIGRSTLPDVDADSYRSNMSEEKNGQVDLGVPRLPVFIRIVEYARNRWQNGRDNGLTLLSFISYGKLNEQIIPNSLQPIAIGSMCNDALLAGNALVIMDGLDEVGNPDQRRAVMQEIDDFVGEYVKLGNKILLTSRIVGYQFHPLTHLPHYTVEDMDDVAIRAFCRAWMAHFYESDAIEDRGKRLANTILEHDHPGVRALAGNPLLLTLLAQVYRESGERALPHRRVDLFEETLKVLYERREYLWDTQNITRLRLARALASVAYYLHTSEPAGFTDRGTISSCLRTVLPNPDQVDEVLAVADEAAGFLVSRGEGVYGFLHRAIQEYFAARYLVDEPSQASSRLLEHILDPTWREILILALGQIGQTRYPVANRKEFVKKIWQDILDFPDPAGDVLPRRALLLGMATSECDQFPREMFGVVVEQLLTVYGRRLAPVIQERIQRAFKAMKTEPTQDVVESALCSFLCSSNSNHRWAAANLIIESQWDSQSITSALIKSWVNFADPAGSLLTAINGIHERHSEYFKDDLLPFRFAMIKEPKLWSKIQNDDLWRIVVEALYIFPGQNFDINNIWRDSPLTSDVLDSLRSDRKSRDWIDYLNSLSCEIDTARGRDVGLILAGFGKISPEIIDSIQEEKTFPHGFVSSLRLLVEFGSIADIARNRELGLALVIAKNMTTDIRSHSRFVTRFLSLDRNSTRNLSIFINHGVNALSFKSVISLAKTIAIALGYDDGIDEDNDVESDVLLFRAEGIIRRAVRRIVTPGDLLRVLTNVRFPNRQISNVDKSLNLVRDLDVKREFDFDYIDIKLGNFQEIGAIVNKHLHRKNVSLTMRGQLESCLDILNALNVVHSGWLQSGIALSDAIRLSPLLSRIKEEILIEKKLTETPLDEIVGDLSSPQDYRRYSALQALYTPISATQLGKERLQTIAQLAIRYNGQPQIGTQLDWTIWRIVFDYPAWINEWINDLSYNEKDDVKEMILENIRRPTADVCSALISSIPHKSKVVNKAILNSLTWQAIYNTIPSDLLAGLLNKLLGWLVDESETEIAVGILKVLGEWKDNLPDVLQRLLNINSKDVVRSYWFDALARIGGRSSLTEDKNRVRELLERNMDDLSTRGSLVRLLISSGEDVSNLPNVISNHRIMLDALLLAGSDFDIWNDKYHTKIVSIVQSLCNEYPEDLIPLLLDALRKSLKDEKAFDKWPDRRIALASIASCIETMPTEVQMIAGGAQELEMLLVEGSKDPGSFNSRRFAITALGYIRTITPTVMPVLLEGVRENVEIVQKDALNAVKHFQKIQGNILPVLIPYLTIENAPATAFGVAKLLGALGTSPAAEIASIRSDIVQGLAEAIKHPNSQQDVVLLKSSSGDIFETERQGKLFDHLAQEMLRVAGWL